MKKKKKKRWSGRASYRKPENAQVLRRDLSNKYNKSGSLETGWECGRGGAGGTLPCCADEPLACIPEPRGPVYHGLLFCINTEESPMALPTRTKPQSYKADSAVGSASASRLALSHSIKGLPSYPVGEPSLTAAPCVDQQRGSWRNRRRSC